VYCCSGCTTPCGLRKSPYPYRLWSSTLLLGGDVYGMSPVLPMFIRTSDGRKLQITEAVLCPPSVSACWPCP
jgi:hypothetical protein